MSVTPLGDRLIVLPAPAIEETKGGIVIPESSRMRPMEGTVVAIGPDVKGLVVGQRVMYGHYAGSDISIDEKWHVLMREDEVLGIVHEEASAYRVITPVMPPAIPQEG